MQKYFYDLVNFVLFFIRELLGGDDYVFVSISLSILFFDVRMFCDDIIIIVVYFDWINVLVD